MFHWLDVLQDLERRPVVSLTSRNSISQSVDSDRGHGANILTHDKPHNSRAFEDVEVCRSMSKYVRLKTRWTDMDRYGQIWTGHFTNLSGRCPDADDSFETDCECNQHF